MTEGRFKWVLKYFDKYRHIVQNSADPPSPADLKAGYGALHRLRDRYEHEKKGLEEKRAEPWREFSSTTFSSKV